MAWYVLRFTIRSITLSSETIDSECPYRSDDDDAPAFLRSPRPAPAANDENDAMACDESWTRDFCFSFSRRIRSRSSTNVS